MPKRDATITHHQLRIFWTVAHCRTLTEAAKQLGIAQPSVSLQLSRLEALVGTTLFDRRAGNTTLPSAGSELLPHVGRVLGEMERLERSLPPFRDGSYASLSIAGITSMVQLLLPDAMRETLAGHPMLSFDIHDRAPLDIIDMLQDRRVRLGLAAASSVAGDTLGLTQTELMRDPMLLVTPRDLVLDGVTDPEADLSAETRAI